MSDARTTPPWRAGVLLAVMALIGVGLLALVNDLTRDRIAEQERQQMLQQLTEVLAPDRYDNDLLQDTMTLADAVAFGHNKPMQVFRARLEGQPAAVIMEVTAPNGYNGDIVMLVGIDISGTVTGVRILRHRETPGLGDPIEKRRSDWIDGFRGRSLGDPPATGWTVRKDGGEFDQFTGATITPRAVVNAVARALEYFANNQARLFEQESQGSSALEPSG